MSRLGFEEYADAVIRDLWVQRVPLSSIAIEARMSLQDVLERVPRLGLPPRNPPPQTPSLGLPSVDAEFVRASFRDAAHA